MGPFSVSEACLSSLALLLVRRRRTMSASLASGRRVRPSALPAGLTGYGRRRCLPSPPPVRWSTGFNGDTTDSGALALPAHTASLAQLILLCSACRPRRSWRGSARRRCGSHRRAYAAGRTGRLWRRAGTLAPAERAIFAPPRAELDRVDDSTIRDVAASEGVCQA